MKSLGGLDASFLYMETPQTPMHVAGLSIVELPKGFKGSFYEVYKRHIASRLHLFPVLKKKIVPVPWDIDHPIWIDDDELDIDYHIRDSRLPKPGTMEQLEDLVGRLHSNFLDRSRPLWEFYVIDGLADDRLAVYTKIHHAAVDGVQHAPVRAVRLVVENPARRIGHRLIHDVVTGDHGPAVIAAG